MAFCSFDEGAAIFDATPVENMFVTEYMLRAPGDFVKVYLYGLMLCYHDAQRMSLAAMARDLDLSEEEVERAFKYWARDGLVRRIGDNPPRYAYRNVKQLTLTRAENPAEKLYDRDFADDIHRILEGVTIWDRDLQIVYDWVDILGLSKEAVLMLLQRQYEKVRSRNKNFSFRIADKVAQDWAQKGIRTIDDVEKLIINGEERDEELRRVLAQLGQFGGGMNPTNKALYNKWRDEWGFDEEAVLIASHEAAKTTPTMKYLDRIMTRLHSEGLSAARDVSAHFIGGFSAREFAHAVFEALGRVGVAPSPEDLATFERWEKDGFTRDVILLAAQRVHKRRMSGNLEDIDSLLGAWRKQGLSAVPAIEAFYDTRDRLNNQLRDIYREADIEKRVNEPDRKLLSKWSEELSMPMALILLAAEYARGNAAAIPTMDRILTDWHAAGIATESAARAEHERHVAARGQERPAKEPMQRHSYTDEDFRRMVVDLDEEDAP